MIDPAPVPVVVASFASLAEAAAARAALARAGIDVLPAHAQTIVVAAGDGEAALAVLQEIWPPDEPEDAPVEPERCPECGSSDLIRIRRLPFFIIFTTLMFGIGHLVGQFDLFALLVAIIAVVLVIGPSRRCLACGELWHGSMLPAPPSREIAVEPPEVACPRCGSVETGLIDRRRMKALTMLVNFVLPPLLFVWPFMPRRKCDNCGHEWR